MLIGTVGQNLINENESPQGDINTLGTIGMRNAWYIAGTPPTMVTAQVLAGQPNNIVGVLH